jgi:hypothetical protein
MVLAVSISMAMRLMMEVVSASETQVGFYQTTKNTAIFTSAYFLSF